MLFNSYIFIFGFLPITLFGFYSLSRVNFRLATGWLAAASLFFYGWWDFQFTYLILISITVNYIFGSLTTGLRKINHRLSLFATAIAIVLNLTALAYFKYANFIISNFSTLTGKEIKAIEIILPMGISFFTFTQIAFLVDSYRGIAFEYNPVNYALFVTYFPHLIAGPVLHHKQMMPQFTNASTFRPQLHNINIGLAIFSIGLAKKVLLADEFSKFSNPVFDAVSNGGEPKVFEAWVGSLAYTFQLYFDFSGYSDMAVGISRLFNVNLPLNFDSPYKAKNVIEFWRRWHMTLSAFLRDYLYIPLGGSRCGPIRRYANLLTTMVLGGLWHGAGWTFIIWGALHGFYLIVNHGFQKIFPSHSASSTKTAWSARLITFGCIVFAWVPFRAENMTAALAVWRGMVGINGLSLGTRTKSMIPSPIQELVSFDGMMPLANLYIGSAIFWLVVGFAVVWFLPNTQEWMSSCQPGLKSSNRESRFKWQPTNAFGLGVGLVLILCLMRFGEVSEFIYSQF